MAASSLSPAAPTPMEFLQLNASRIGWWVLVGLIVVVALIAIVFAGLAFGESQVSQPNRNIVRQDIIAKGDLAVQGDTQLNEVKSNSITTQSVTTNSWRYTDVVVITTTEPFELKPDRSVYRIDTPGANTIDVLLPPVKEAPGCPFHVLKSIAGSQNNVRFHLAAGDVYADAAGQIPAKLNPCISLLPAQPDHIRFSNDFQNVWFGSAHT
jgi:hypothetical protein